MRIEDQDIIMAYLLCTHSLYILTYDLWLARQMGAPQAPHSFPQNSLGRNDPLPTTVHLLVAVVRIGGWVGGSDLSEHRSNFKKH